MTDKFTLNKKKFGLKAPQLGGGRFEHPHLLCRKCAAVLKNCNFMPRPF